MMISQLFREVIFGKNQQSLYSIDCFVYEMILVGSGFKVKRYSSVRMVARIQTQRFIFQPAIKDEDWQQ
jgi:hypothetical protein